MSSSKIYNSHSIHTVNIKNMRQDGKFEKI